MENLYLIKVEEIDFSSSQIWTQFCLIFVLIYVIKALLFGRVLQKAGEKSWKAWVPFVNIWAWFKIGGYKGAHAFWLIGAIIAFVTTCFATAEIQYIVYSIGVLSMIVFTVVAIASGIHIQKKLGKPLPFIILLFINLIAPLWMWILALDRSKWSGKKGKKTAKKKSKK